MDAYCITKLMGELGGIDKIVLSLKLAHRACLKELVPLVRCSRGISRADPDIHWTFLHGKHILLQPEAERTLKRHFPPSGHQGIRGEGKAAVEIDLSVIIYKDARIKNHGIICMADGRAVRIADMAIKSILSGRTVADRDAHLVVLSVKIIQVIPPVRPFGHIRGSHAFPVRIRIIRILQAAVDVALETPVREIILRGGIADIGIQAEATAVKPIMGAIDIDSSVKDMGFSIRDILVAGEIGVESLFFHGYFLSGGICRA
jgi:hypothetical protein